MSYGQPHSATIPTVAATTGTEYASMVNAVLTEMRATLNAKVTPAGMQINADLSMRNAGTRYGLTDVHRLSLYQQPAQLSAGTYPAALFASAAGELYFNDAAGNSVQLTNGGSLNGTPGSITGAGYGSAGVEVNWDAGASDYHLYSGSGTYADVNVSAAQFSDGSGNFVRVAAPAGMSADYTITWPPSAPAATSVLFMTSAGVVTTTAPSRSRQIDLLRFYQTSGTNLSPTTSTGVATGGVDFSTPVIGNRASVPVPMAVGETLQSIQIVMNENLSGGNGRVTFRLYKGGSLITSANSAGSGTQTVTLTHPSPAVLSASTTTSDAYVLDIEVDGNTGVVEVKNAYVTYT